MLPGALLTALSPCPNDTFSFAPWVLGRISSSYPLQASFHDIEVLNTYALSSNRFDLIKISAACYGRVQDRYEILSSGAAFALRGGPLLVRKKGSSARVEHLAIPGKNTSSYVAYTLLYGIPARVTEMSYEQIVPSVLSGVCDSGIIIHEGRFSVPTSLDTIVDLGDAFTKRFSCPLPLGVIVAKRSLGEETIARLDMTLQYSISFALNEKTLCPLVLEHAHELTEDIIWRHIHCYVSDETVKMSEEGRRAIQLFMELS